MSEITIGFKPPPIWVVSRQIDRAKIYFWEGINQQNLFNHERAVYLFGKALKRDSDFVIAAYQAIWSDIARGRYPEAIDALRACVIKFDALQKSCDTFEEEQVRENKPEEDFLCSLYEILILFNALLVKTQNKALGDRLLVEYLYNDQALPEGKKPKEILVRGLLGNQTLILRSKDGTRTIGPQELYEDCLKTLYVNLARGILGYFGATEDYAAMKNILVAKIKIIDSQKENKSPGLLEIKRGMQINLAKILLKIGETKQCRSILEEVSQEIPGDIEVQQLLDKLNSLN